MKPAPFEYYRPANLAEALALLAEIGEDASLLSGGQSLIPLLNMRLSRPANIIDLNHLSELDYVRVEDNWLKIGALTRQRKAELNLTVKGYCPLLTEALGLIGHTPIRNRGTIGGNIAHADPASEIPAVLVALGGAVVLTGQQGARVVPASEFFVSVLTTVREAHELVTEVRFPVVAGGGWSFYEISRQAGNYAMAGAGVWLELDAEGKIRLANIGLCSVAPTPLKPVEAEAFLVGQVPTLSLFKEAGQLAAASTDPATDLHADAEYRRALAAVVVERALTQAYERTA